MVPTRRTALVAGATGLVGSEVLAGLLGDDSVAAVHAVGRRKPALGHPKLVAHVVDPKSPGVLPRVDEVYLALGTTIKVAGSQEAFRAVDFDANLAVARAAIAAGARRVGLVSAMGADARSRVFYNRVKGELEEALCALALDALVIARPSLLVGDRRALGQPDRRLERLFLGLSSGIAPLVPAAWRPIAAAHVARALRLRVPVAHGREVIESARLREIAEGP